MPKGPILNNISKSFTTRDNLGIEGVATTIQASICPVINTVTPRVFYWPFLVWIYYDFYRHSEAEKVTADAFSAYLKRQDYFFVMANLLVDGSDQNGLNGKQQTIKDINQDPDGPYVYNPAYFQSKYGGMQYYNAGCLSMYFIIDRDPETDKQLSVPKLTKEGEQLALAFQSVIKNTEYYKRYRLQKGPVPRHVLEEYGRAIRFDFQGFTECKEIMKKYFFEDTRAIQLRSRSEILTESREYVKLLVQQYVIPEMRGLELRRALYDYRLHDGTRIIIPETLKTVANKWEIVIGRQYFTLGLEMIWKKMLEQLSFPMTKMEWVRSVFGNSEFSLAIQKPLASIVDDCDLSFEEIEDVISDAMHGQKMESSVENGLRVILAVYNRFSKKTDFGDEKAFLEYGADTQSIAIVELFEKVKEYWEKPCVAFLQFIIEEWLIEQHYLTAFGKMLQGRDGFYYELIDGKYIRKHYFDLAFQGIRLTSLTQVMRDLDIL